MFVIKVLYLAKDIDDVYHRENWLSCRWLFHVVSSLEARSQLLLQTRKIYSELETITERL